MKVQLPKTKVGRFNFVLLVLSGPSFFVALILNLHRDFWGTIKTTFFGIMFSLILSLIIYFFIKLGEWVERGE